jgi:hypothetical protein
MTTRRDFLKQAGGAAGIVFCGCAMHDVARAQQPGAARLPVVVNGKRIKTIDVHAHCHFHEAIALMGDEGPRVLPQTKGAQEHFIVIAERLKGMDAQAIDMAVLSINPFWYRKDRDTAAATVKVQNEKLAELSASRPDRFAAFASLALQYPDLAVEQLETAVKKLGLRGAAASPARSLPIRNFTRSGPRRKSSARCCSSTHRARRSWPSASRATAGCRTPSATRSTPPSPCNTSSSKGRSTASRD